MSSLKRYFALFFICLFLILPFAAAENVTSLLNTYNNAKKHFDTAKEELIACQATGDDCEDVEEDVLDAAIDTTKEGITLMLAYLAYSGIDDSAVTDLEKARDDLSYVQDKADFEEVVASAKTTWASVSLFVKQKTVEDLYVEVEKLIDKGELIDAKLSCGVEELGTSDKTLDSAVASFSAAIATADQKIDAAEKLLSKGENLDSILATIKDAQASLKESQSSLSTAHNALTAAGGSLCTEVTIIDDEDEDDEDTDEEDEDEQEIEQVEEEAEEEEEEQDLDDLLADYGLNDYYDDGQEAIENLEEYISDKEDDGYDATDAKKILQQAKDYLAQGEDLVLESQGKGAISRFFNAQQTAERGMNNEYYDYGSGTSSASGSADYVAFVACMEEASYSYQKTACYEDYGIGDGTQSTINACLTAASDESDRLTCYSEADEEATEQEGDDEEALQERLEAVQDSLDDLEKEVTALYDNLADSGESASSDDYKAVDSAIDTLLATVRGDIYDYKKDLDKAEDQLDLGDEDEADELLDTLEDDVEEFIEDIQQEITEIQEDIDAL